ncbi:DUF6333 family protein [Streptomyces sp. NPDC048483]|uniref:DUF6333 family protein n=1 Tax=Streptomyces sp. NPDC048483 TaxID=3154927 RepID=UPI003442775A
MTDNSMWEHPPEARILRHGGYTLTVIDNPTPHAFGSLPPNDHARARQVAESLLSVESVGVELGPMRASDIGIVPHHTRSDLEQVHIGCWGPVIEITDAALVDRMGSFALRDQAEELAKEYPNAAVIGSASIDFSIDYSAYVVIHPTGVRLWADGYTGEETWDVRDDSVSDVIAAFCASAELPPGFDFDVDPQDMNYAAALEACLKAVVPSQRHHLTLSSFRVTRTEEAIGDLEETWLDE